MDYLYTLFLFMSLFVGGRILGEWLLNYWERQEEERDRDLAEPRHQKPYFNPRTHVERDKLN